jgi:aldose 1-epimerase
MDSLPTFRPFGSLPSGQTIEAWTLTGNSGLLLEAITYGGIVTRLLQQGQSGDSLDLVLGFDSLQPYLEGHPYFGAIVGRVAGRISNAHFQIDGQTYPLGANNGLNHLHGGLQGFDKKVWAATPSLRPDGSPSLRLAYRSPDGEEGYPGTVVVSVTYTVTNENAFLIETEASTDKATPFSLTHHSYFNLAGEGSGTIEDHTLQIHADSFIPSDSSMTLLDRIESVDGQPQDFRIPKLLADAIPLLPQNHGALYPVPGPTEYGQMVRIAQVTHPESGRILTCSTNETHLQVYTASALDCSHPGKSGKRYGRYAGLCLECEGYANGANARHIGDIILRPGMPQRRITEYAFSQVADPIGKLADQRGTDFPESNFFQKLR